MGRLDTLRPELSLRVGVYGHFAPVDWPQVFVGPAPGIDLCPKSPHHHELQINHTKEVT